MNKLIFVLIGFVLAAVILSLLTVLVRRRRAKAVYEIDRQAAQPGPIEQPEEGAVQASKEQEALVAEKAQSAEASSPAADVAVTTGARSVDEAIQNGFTFLANEAYDQALSSFQEGLRMTEDAKVATRLYVELAKIHNSLNQQDAAIRNLDAALEYCRKSSNGTTEQEILNIKHMISSQENVKA